MPRSVDEGFRDFDKKLTPSSAEAEAARKHRASVEACLEANYKVLRFFRSGSYGNGTSIRYHSDVDHFVSLDDKHKNLSTSVLSNLRSVFKSRFPHTSVYVRTPAVRIDFGSGGSLKYEIVPAFLKSTSGLGYTYEIPKPGGGWMKSSPEGHNKYVAKQNDRLNKGVKPLIRFIKAWKYYNDVPISSFYLELRVAKYSSTQDLILYSWDVEKMFRQLSSNDLAAITDPTGAGGYIYPCSSDSDKTTALSKVRTAARRAANAREMEEKAKISDAFDWWDKVFAGKFPSYYY